MAGMSHTIPISPVTGATELTGLLTGQILPQAFHYPRSTATLLQQQQPSQSLTRSSMASLNPVLAGQLSPSPLVLSQNSTATTNTSPSAGSSGAARLANTVSSLQERLMGRVPYSDLSGGVSTSTTQASPRVSDSLGKLHPGLLGSANKQPAGPGGDQPETRPRDPSTHGSTGSHIQQLLSSLTASPSQALTPSAWQVLRSLAGTELAYLSAGASATAAAVSQQSETTASQGKPNTSIQSGVSQVFHDFPTTSPVTTKAPPMSPMITQARILTDRQIDLAKLQSLQQEGAIKVSVTQANAPKSTAASQTLGGSSIVTFTSVCKPSVTLPSAPEHGIARSAGTSVSTAPIATVVNTTTASIPTITDSTSTATTNDQSHPSTTSSTAENESQKTTPAPATSSDTIPITALISQPANTTASTTITISSSQTPQSTTPPTEMLTTVIQASDLKQLAGFVSSATSTAVSRTQSVVTASSGSVNVSATTDAKPDTDDDPEDQFVDLTETTDSEASPVKPLKRSSESTDSAASPGKPGDWLVNQGTDW